MIEWGHPDPICLKNRLLFRFSKIQWYRTKIPSSFIRIEPTNLKQCGGNIYFQLILSILIVHPDCKRVKKRHVKKLLTLHLALCILHLISFHTLKA